MNKTEINKIIDVIEIKNKFTTILGSNNSGKTTLAKELEKEFDSSIVLYSKPKNISGTVEEYLNISKKIPDDLLKLIQSLKIEELFKYSFNKLSIGEKQLVQIILALSSNYETIILDNSLSMISTINKERILKYLSKLKDKTIINITSNKEDIIYGKMTMLLNNNEIVLKGKTDNIITDEKKFKEIGFELPFMALLSLKLKYYSLIDKPILSMDRMVNKLWK